MKVKIGNKIYDGKNEPVMVILSRGEKMQIAEMPLSASKYCIYPTSREWVQNNYAKIKEWMKV